MLNYPNFNILRETFTTRSTKGEMWNLRHHFDLLKANFYDYTVLGNFVDNHDNGRFLNQEGSIKSYQSALAFIISQEGIPIIYYGTEQSFSGANDPYCREALWTSMNT